MMYSHSSNWPVRRAVYCLYCVSLALVFVINLAAQTAASGRPPEATRYTTLYKRTDGVVFTRGVHANLHADMYLPLQPGMHAAVIFLHGGGWKQGDRTQMEPVARALAEHGYVGMAIDYDLSGEGARFPVALKEAERAVQWLRENAARFDVDSARIAVAGSSAGGELAALLALDDTSPPGSRVHAAVIFNGVLDLSYTGPDAEDMVAPYLGGTCSAQPARCAAASPVKLVHAGAPPFFVGHGTADRIVPYSQATAFVKELRAGHVPVQEFVAEGAGHTYWTSPQWRDANIAAVLDFLKEHLAEPTNASSARTH